ncbi:hypothetical protein [Serinicoccus profundi]|uniref:hypothetical protein n=1 Tax=Serinicoccus profundi TaxID=1078471 RepID=UPI000255E759|nr:hypothetical protein [Serinicoccus profundi]
MGWAEEVAGVFAGDGSVAEEVGGVGGSGEQGGVGHHEADLDVDAVDDAAAGEAVVELVGHELLQGAGVAAGAAGEGVLVQGLVAGDGLGCGEAGGEQGHDIGCGS